MYIKKWPHAQVFTEELVHLFMNKMFIFKSMCHEKSELRGIYPLMKMVCVFCFITSIWSVLYIHEGLDGGWGGIWISLISKNLAHNSLSLKIFLIP